MGRAPLHLALAVTLVAGLAAGCSKSPPPEGEDGEAESLRILSLTPNVTEILFAMGLGDRVVGRSNYCNFPPQAKSVPAVGDTISLNLEKIISLKPNLALVVTKRPDLVRTIEGLGIRTVRLESDTMAELMQTIETIGRETGWTGPAENVKDMIQDRLDKVRRRVKGRDRPKVLFVLAMTIGSPKMMVAGRGTFVDELLNVAGAENAYPDVADWPTITVPRVIALAPEIVIVNAVGKDAAPDRVKAIRQAWANWTSVPAVAPPPGLHPAR